MVDTSKVIAFSDIEVGSQFIPVAEYDIEFDFSETGNAWFTKSSLNTFKASYDGSTFTTKNTKMKCYLPIA